VLTKLFSNRYGTGSGSDRVNGARSLPLPSVPQTTFPYIQQQTDAGKNVKNLVNAVINLLSIKVQSLDRKDLCLGSGSSIEL